MTNEQLLMEIGRMMGKAIQESEERMKVYVHDVVTNAVQTSENRMNVRMNHLSLQIQKLSSSVENLRGAVQHTIEDTEKLAQQIAATVERMETLESAS